MNNSGTKENIQKGSKFGYKVVIGVGVAAGLYGFTAGRKAGFSEGVYKGYKAASDDYLTMMNDLIDEIRKTRGE